MPVKGTKKSKISGKFIPKDEYDKEIREVLAPKTLKTLAEAISKYFAVYQVGMLINEIKQINQIK